MALPNKPLGELKAVRDPEVEEREVDIYVVTSCRGHHDERF